MNSSEKNISDLDVNQLIVKSYGLDKVIGFTLFFAISAIWTLVGNGLVLYLTLIHKQFHESYMYIRAAFSVLDIIGILISMPFVLADMFGHRNPENIWCMYSAITSGLW